MQVPIMTEIEKEIIQLKLDIAVRDREIASLKESLEKRISENLELLKQTKELEKTLQHREHCIDWVLEHYPETISDYLERKYND